MPAKNTTTAALANPKNSTAAAQINPAKPEGLVPPPRTVDTDPKVHEQLKKPLIPENRKSSDDLMHAQKK